MVYNIADFLHVPVQLILNRFTLKSVRLSLVCLNYINTAVLSI